MPYKGNAGGTGEFPFTIFEQPGLGDVPVDVAFTYLLTRGASVVELEFVTTDLGPLSSGAGRNYLVNWLWPETAGLYRLVLESNYSSDIITADFEVGTSDTLTATDMQGVTDAVLDEDLTEHNAPNSLASYIKQICQSIPDATELMTFVVKYPDGSPVPFAALTLRDSNNVRLTSLFVGSNGRGVVEMAQGVGFTVTASRQDLSFAPVTFDVEAGGSTVNVVGDYSAAWVAGQ